MAPRGLRDKFRICLITPGHISTNPRLAKEADALVGGGYAVSILACDYMLWGRQADGAYVGKSFDVIAPIRFGPLAPAAARGKQALRRRFARGLFDLGLSNDWLVCAAWHPAGPDLVRAAQSIVADLYIAHYPAALPAAAAAARRHGGRYAFDAEDFHLGDPAEGPEHDRTRRLTRALEGRYLPGAAYVSAASPDIAEAYAEAYGVRTPAVLLNVFPWAEAPPAPTERGDARPGPSLYWFSQTIGPDRGLECALQAIARARSLPHLYVRGQFAAGYRARLEDLARSLGCAERLHALEPAPPSQMVRLAGQFDLGLASEIGHTPNNKRALSNKLFTYLLAGVPTLISDTPAQARFAAAHEAYLRRYAHSDPQDLADGLDEFLLNPGRLAEARAAAWRIGQSRYNWDIESRALVDLVDRVLLDDAAAETV